VPRRWPVGFRRKVLDLIEADESVAEIAETAAQLGLTAHAVYNCGTRTGSIVLFALACRRRNSPN
jgi:hypothetical protein